MCRKRVIWVNIFDISFPLLLVKSHSLWTFPVNKTTSPEHLQHLAEPCGLSAQVMITKHRGKAMLNSSCSWGFQKVCGTRLILSKDLQSTTLQNSFWKILAQSYLQNLIIIYCICSKEHKKQWLKTLLQGQRHYPRDAGKPLKLVFPWISRQDS